MIELRNAVFEDHVAIAKLHAESWRQNYRGILSNLFLNDAAEQDRLTFWYNRFETPAANQHITVATLDKKMVGFSCMYIDDDAVFGTLLDNLHIATNSQGLGIGALLMKACAKIILEKSSSKKMYLWVFEQNEKARRFYERLSGHHFKTIEKQVFDSTFARVCAYTWDDVSILL